MYQRLLVLLITLFISYAAISQDVMSASDGDYIYNSGALSGSLTNPVPQISGSNIIQKWVHDPNQSGKSGRIPWNQTNFKSYRINNLSYRLRYPVSYDPTKKYPCVVFLHGAGEAASINDKDNATSVDRENQDQLYWGAQLFEQRMVAGEWNGFLLFPQLLAAANGDGTQWDNSTFPNINTIFDTLTKYNGLDQDRIITMGLSAGGYGGVNYARYYPQRIASAVVANPRFIEQMISPDLINPMLQIPMYITAGGTDDFPGPEQVLQFRDSMVRKGGNVYFGYNPTIGHSSWTPQWAETDIYNKFVISAWWNSAHKAQPLLYYKSSQFCADTPINAKMGITDGFNAYEWQYNAGGGFATIPGATVNTYTATQAGSYRVHFKRTASSNWSDWTPSPIVISTKTCSADTAFAEHFETSPINPYVTLSASGVPWTNSPYYVSNINCQNGVFVNSTEVFTQDGSGRQGGTFMLNNTFVSSGCAYYAGDQVWRTYNPATVTPNTDYTLNFYMGNNSQSLTSSSNSPVAQLVPKINGVALSAIPAQSTLTGDLSWKKYSYTWNSGNNTTAEIAITNNTTDGTGNDFVLDEISLVKYVAPNLPAGVNSTLWSKAGTVTGNDGSVVRVWANSDVNGNGLQQDTVTREPILKNNATDNINFNPVVTYTSSNGKNSFTPGGFSSNGTVHNSVHAYFVMRANSISSGQTIFSEGQSTGTGDTLSFTTASNGRVAWNAGTTAGGNLLNSPNNSNDLSKPTIWTLSKDNINGTGDGNKQDIRKNGVLIASSSSTTTFTTGNKNIFRVGARRNFGTGSLNASIAEIIYLLDTTINTSTENKIESYLALKYGTTLGYKAKPVTYAASDGTIIWPATNASYQTDVFGIGTDSVSGLVQSQSNSVNSGSGDGTGQSAKGNLVLSTNTTLLDKRFLMIGNDSANLSQAVIPAGGALTVAVGSTRLNREWKVANTGSAGAVTLSFDTTGLGNQAGGANISNYALMIDNDGDGDFSNGTISFFGATSASGKKIIFSGVTLNNGVVFTVLTLKISSTLPATWLGFTAEAVNGNALLNWKTSDEINVDRYIVEHSYNGISFSTIGSVTANNNTGVNNYTYTDRDLAAGTHYYRIRRIDKDGKSDYTDIKSIKIAASGANIQVRPNPVAGSTLVLAVTVPQSTKTYVQVLSVDGKLMLRQTINLLSGSNLVNLNISDVPTGVYLLQVQLNDEVITKKFIRSH